MFFFFFQAEDGIRDAQESRGLGDVYKRQILLFNNEIYGLTKGQYSPTSRLGTRSPSTPTGSIDPPVSALQFAMGANARFIARTIDRRQDHMPAVLSRAAAPVS